MHTVGSMGTKRTTTSLLGLAAGVTAIWACDLPPGFDEVDTDDRAPVGSANVSIPPDDERWTNDFVGWQFGGQFGCAGIDSQPVVVELWDGVEAPCEEDVGEGDRVLRLQISDTTSGTYQVALQCAGPQTAGVNFVVIRGGQAFETAAEEGTVTLTGFGEDILQGAFNVRFEGRTSFTSGGFRADTRCF